MSIKYRMQRIKKLTFSDLYKDPKKTEKLRKLFNKVGERKWEVYQIQEVNNGLMIFMLRRV